MVSVEQRAARLAVESAFEAAAAGTDSSGADGLPASLERVRASLSTRKGRQWVAEAVAAALETARERVVLPPTRAAEVVAALLNAKMGGAQPDFAAISTVLRTVQALCSDSELRGGGAPFMQALAAHPVWSEYGAEPWYTALRGAVEDELGPAMQRASATAAAAAVGNSTTPAELRRRLATEMLPELLATAHALGAPTANLTTLLAAVNEEYGTSCPEALVDAATGMTRGTEATSAASAADADTERSESTSEPLSAALRLAAPPPVPLLAGERLVWRVTANFTSGLQSLPGTLLLTTYRLAFELRVLRGACGAVPLEQLLLASRVGPDAPYTPPVHFREHHAAVVRAVVDRDASHLGGGRDGGEHGHHEAAGHDCLRSDERWGPPLISIPVLSIERVVTRDDGVIAVRCKDQPTAFFRVSDDDEMSGRCAALLTLVAQYSRASFDAEREAADSAGLERDANTVPSRSPLPRPFCFAHARAVKACELEGDDPAPEALRQRLHVLSQLTLQRAVGVLAATQQGSAAASTREASRSTIVLGSEPLVPERGRAHTAISPRRTMMSGDASAALSPSATDGAVIDGATEEATVRGTGIDGWQLYDVDSEFRRQGAVMQGWRVANVNHHYHLCSTYPRRLVVPVGAGEHSLADVAKFRSRERLAVLTWFNRNNAAALLRSSQPKVGVLGKQSEGDQRLLELARVRTIFDARPRKNALGNRAMGKGTEIAADYADLEVVFLDIENIHVMRSSLQRLRALLEESGTVDVAGDSNAGGGGGFASAWATGGDAGAGGAGDGGAAEEEHSNFHELLGASKWLVHVQGCLRGAARVVKSLWDDGRNGLVHCSDGWDRTSQICALAQLLMDPFFRTIRGFCVLVEKDWCSFGHMFQRRLGHGDDDPTDEQRSPIFLQFLDCVWQVWRQYKRSFEFNERFIEAVAYHAYSCRFGTFLFNCERERLEARVSERTESLWTYLLRHADSFRNEHFRPRSTPLRPMSNLHSLELWPYHYRLYPAMHPREDGPLPENYALHAAVERDALEAEIRRLRQELVEARRAATERNTDGDD